MSRSFFGPTFCPTPGRDDPNSGCASERGAKASASSSRRVGGREPLGRCCHLLAVTCHPAMIAAKTTTSRTRSASSPLSDTMTVRCCRPCRPAPACWGKTPSTSGRTLRALYLAHARIGRRPTSRDAPSVSARPLVLHEVLRDERIGPSAVIRGSLGTQ
jgi:hypothetical protein